MLSNDQGRFRSNFMPSSRVNGTIATIRSNTSTLYELISSLTINFYIHVVTKLVISNIFIMTSCLSTLTHKLLKYFTTTVQNN